MKKYTFSTFCLYATNLHKFFITIKSKNCKTICYSFTECAKIRFNFILRLIALQMPSETGNHFFKNEKRTVLLAEIFYLMQEGIFRTIGIRHSGINQRRWLKQNTGNLPGILIKKFFNGFDIIVIEFYSKWFILIRYTTG